MELSVLMAAELVFSNGEKEVVREVYYYIEDFYFENVLSLGLKQNSKASIKIFSFMGKNCTLRHLSVSGKHL